jgi:hypothetical protein
VKNSALTVMNMPLPTALTSVATPSLAVSGPAGRIRLTNPAAAVEPDPNDAVIHDSCST